jgi:hypothetical protein
MHRNRYLGVRLNEAEYEAYQKALFYFLDLDVMSNSKYSISDLFRMLVDRLPKIDYDPNQALCIAKEYASLIKA